jgi:hypothetical protein
VGEPNKVGVCNPLNPTYNIFKEREVDNPFVRYPLRQSRSKRQAPLMPPPMIAIIVTIYIESGRDGIVSPAHFPPLF